MITFCVEISARQKHHQIQKGVAQFWLLVVLYELAIWEGVHSWNYNYSTTDMTWPAAREFCREFFTDLVAIQNHEEINYLNYTLPRNPTYYWIGIRKIGGVWTWVGTNKSLDKGAENWAVGEPTPGVEDCVEIYIQRENDAGKWNNEPCLERSKRALCYLASCKPTSCSGHGECVETIGNYTCRCNEGLYGPECEFFEQCATLNAPDQATMGCTHPNGNFSFSSTCDFHCAAGFTLQGSQSLRCNATGIWTAETPSCEAVKCDVPKSPRNGNRNCSHPFGNFSYRSTCDFGCVEGFSLNGSVSLQCEGSGTWSSPIPTCEAVKCDVPKIPRNGNRNCSHPIGNFSYRSTCDFGCVEGFSLNGSVSLQCGGSGTWSSPIPTCEAVKCDVPKSPRNGNRNCSHPFGNFSYRSTCDFGCVEGFSLNGSVSLQCEGSGTWSSPIPTCEGTQQELYKSTGFISTAVAISAGLTSVPFVIWIIKHYRKKMMQRHFSPVSS
uniref:L-selectin-like isoform X2 n=1 Tax=Pristiophorus japonicus TaxID=55135 RepID=UPI00398EB6D4